MLQIHFSQEANADLAPYETPCSAITALMTTFPQMHKSSALEQH